MKRCFFRGERAAQAGRVLLGERKDFDPARYDRYPELELVLQEDGRSSLWGNLGGDADLLQDTRRDPRGLARDAAAWADEVWDEPDGD